MGAITMLDAVLIVLREVLEAALLLSLLLALGSKIGTGSRWAWVAAFAGLVGSWLLSRYAYALAEAFDGVGQELVNTALYLAAIFSFVVLNLLLVPRLLRWPRGAADERSERSDRTAFTVLFVIIVMCSMAREGAEVWIYLSGFSSAPDAFAAGLAGGLIGGGIGVSIGIIVYYVLHLVSARTFLPLFFVTATLVAGGLSMQGAKQLMQIGWLESGSALWNTRWLVSEQSWLGQLLHALFGYVAKPDQTQVLFYLGSLLLIIIGSAMRALFLRRGSRD